MMDVSLHRSLVESALEASSLVKGACWCPLSKKWWDAFAGFVGLNNVEQTGVSPKSIQSGELLEAGSASLKPGLLEGVDYVLVPKNVYDMLKEWYGGSPPIQRFVIEEGEGSKAMLRVEVYLLKVRVMVWDEEFGVAHVCDVSKRTLSHELLEQQCKRLGLPVSETRLFTMDGEGNEVLPETVLEPNVTLEDALIAPMQRICVQRKRDGKFPPLPTEKVKMQSQGAVSGEPHKKGGFLRRFFGKKENGHANAVAADDGVAMEATTAAAPVLETGNVTALSEKGGLCGLSNLGNTCFMNGAVQALLHCDPLVQFFLAGKHKKELNKRNPLGMKGELALALAELTKEVWRSPVGSAVAPKQLKHVVGRFAPQFQGYQQHDSHELLAFLLDGVHEDLNRVQEKVYVDLDDIKGELDDQQRSKALWEKHELRNRSVIVDLFQAQLKSTIVCPSVTEGGCGRQSVTFDAFAYLSLPVPMPEGEKKFFEVAMMRDPSLDGRPWFAEMPIKYSVEVGYTDTMGQVCGALASLCCADPAQKHVLGSLVSGRSRLTLCEQLSHKIFRSYQISQSANIASTREQLFAYELPVGSESELFSHVSFSHAKLSGKSSSTRGPLLEGFGLAFIVPFYIDVPLTVLSFYQTIWRAVSCYVRDELWTTVGKMSFLPADATSEQIIAAKSEFQKAGPPEGTVQPDGCWRVDHSRWTEDDENKGRTVIRYQVLKNRNTLSAFPFKIRWGCDSYNSTCLRCGNFVCGGCDLAETADEKDVEPELNRVLLLNLRGKLSMVLVWPDDERRASVLDVGVVLNVRLNASVKANRTIVANGGRKSSLTLQDCLNFFQQNEKLDRNNTWYCNVCKDHKEAWKMMQIHSLPTVLVVQLKRFRNQGGYRNKISLPVTFPISGLDMSQYVLSARQGGWVYDLFAVVNHLGDLGGGHYTAYAKHNVTHKWYLFDDSRVALVENEASIISSAAYILFYVRRE